MSFFVNTILPENHMSYGCDYISAYNINFKIKSSLKVH